MQEEIYVFRVTAPIFLVEDTDYDYSDTDVRAYIAENDVATALAEEIASGFETSLTKCLQSTSYNAETGLMTATFDILDSSMENAESIKDYILDLSFEDGIYEGERANFTVDDEHVGVFDIRDERDLQVELIGKKPGPSQADYEDLWRSEYAEDRPKIGAAEVIEDWHTYNAVTEENRREVHHNLYVKYALRHIYNVTYIFIQLLKKPFYTTAEEHLAALRRIIA